MASSSRPAAGARIRPPARSEQQILDGVQLRLIDPDNGPARERFRVLAFATITSRHHRP